jgi:chemotaxis protein CheD
MDTQIQNNKEEIVVGMGEIAVSKQPSSVFACLGLGSCIAVCVFDPVSKVGGMVHVVLPLRGQNDESTPAKYADSAIPLLLQEIIKLGAFRTRLMVKLAGGAQMSLAPGLDGAFKIGEKNAEQILAAFGKEKIPVSATDIGGNRGRTVRMFLDTGKVTVRCAGMELKEL